MFENFLNVLVQTSPQLAVAALCIIVNYRLTVRWMNRVEEAHRETAKAMGEVTEALRHLNGGK